MVTKVLGLIYKEVRGLHQAAYVLALFALASQILALVRDRLLAHEFGAGYELDIYYAAFRIPDLLYVLFASVLSIYVLLPFVTKARQDSDGAGRQVLAQMFTLFLIGYTVIAAGVALLAPSIVPWLFPGFAVSAHAEIVLLLRILLLQPFLLGLSSLFGVVTQIHHRFVLYALSPLLYNIGIIIGVIGFYPLWGVSGLAFGVVLGALGHLLVQWPLVRKSNLAFSLTWQFQWPLLRRVALIAIPRALTLSIVQLQFLALVALASFMTVGSVAVLQLAFNLQSVPLAIIGMSYSVAAFPVLADLLVKNERLQFNLYVMTALRHIIFWSIPIITLSIVLRAQIVRVLLGSGSFNWEDTRLTAAALGLFILSLAGQAIILLLVRAFYAGGLTRLPLILTAIGAMIGVGSAYALFLLFTRSSEFSLLVTTLLRLDDVTGAAVLMLPLGFTLGVLVELVCLLFVFSRKFGMSLRPLWSTTYQALLAGLSGGAVAYLTLAFVVEGINQGTFIGIFLQGLIAGCLGVLAVIITYEALSSRELHELTRSFRPRLFKTDVVAPQPDIL